MLQTTMMCIVVSNVWLASDSPRALFWGRVWLALGATILLVHVVRNCLEV
jgi:hypothetical protein